MRPPQPPQSVHYEQPDQQELAEVISCLVLRTGSMTTEITSAERQGLYDLLPKGFGLVILAQGAGRVQLTVTGAHDHAVLEKLVAKLEQGGGQLARAEVPDRFYPKETDDAGPR